MAGSTPEPPGLGDDELPDSYRSANAESMRGQNRYVCQTRLQLVLLTGAAALAALPARPTAPDWAAVFSAACFLAAIGVRVWGQRSRDDRLWYDGRAAAESVKTLAWRFAVGGQPFSISGDDVVTRQLYLDQLREVSKVLHYVTVVPVADSIGDITPRMLELRESSLGARREAYLTDRILEQRDWYAKEARNNEQLSRRWGLTVVAFEFIGGIGAILRAAALINIDVLGVLSAVAAAALAWIQMRQFGNLASAYSVTARELNRIRSQPVISLDEQGWSEFVNEAEEAISREHTLWTASRGAVLT